MNIQMYKRGFSTAYFSENRLLAMAPDRSPESVGETPVPEVDPGQATPERLAKIEEEGGDIVHPRHEEGSPVFHNGVEIARGRLLINMKKGIPSERIKDVMKELSIEGEVIEYHEHFIQLQVPHERIDEIKEKLDRHPDVEFVIFSHVLRPNLAREGGSGSNSDKSPERDESEEPEQEARQDKAKEEKEKPRSLIAEVLAFLIELVSKLRNGTGFNVSEYADNRSLRRQLRIIEGRMEAIDAHLARRDLSPQDRRELMRQNETLEQEYQKVEKQLREQQEQQRKRTAGAREGGEGESERGRTGADRGRRYPEVTPRSEAQRALMEYVERVERGEEDVDLEEFRTLLVRVVAEISPEERRKGLQEIAQGLNGLLMEMHEHFGEFLRSLPQEVRAQYSSSPEEAKNEAISFFKEAWAQLIEIVNGVYEEVGENIMLVMDGNGVVSVRERRGTGSGEGPRSAPVSRGEREQRAGVAGSSPGRSVEQNVTVNVNAGHPQESQTPAPAAQEAPEYKLSDLDTNALRNYLRSIGYQGDFSVKGDELIIAGIRGGTELNAVQSFVRGFPDEVGISRTIKPETWGSTGTYEARIKLTSEAIGHICSLPASSAERTGSLERPAGDYVEFIPATEFHRNGMVPITVPANIMKKVGMGERERVILIKQVSKGKFEIPRYLGDARELPSFSPERWSTEPSADQIIAERLGIRIEHQSGGVAITIPEKWVWSSAEGAYHDGPPLVVNGAKVVGTDLRNSPYYFG